MKAQIWSTDFVISIVIFFSVFALLIFSINNISSQNEIKRNFEDINNKISIVSESLVRTKGLPENWNSSNVILIGLASEENILNETKLNEFNNTEYQKIKEIFGYDFYFNLTDSLNGTIYLEKGLQPPSNANLVVPVERYCLYRDRLVNLKLIFWI